MEKTERESKSDSSDNDRPDFQDSPYSSDGSKLDGDEAVRETERSERSVILIVQKPVVSNPGFKRSPLVSRHFRFFARPVPSFSNSLINHNETIKEITTVTVVWIADLN